MVRSSIHIQIDIATSESAPTTHHYYTRSKAHRNQNHNYPQRRPYISSPLTTQGHWDEKSILPKQIVKKKKNGASSSKRVQGPQQRPPVKRRSRADVDILVNGLSRLSMQKRRRHRLRQCDVRVIKHRWKTAVIHSRRSSSIVINNPFQPKILQKTEAVCNSRPCLLMDAEFTQLIARIRACHIRSSCRTASDPILDQLQMATAAIQKIPSTTLASITTSNSNNNSNISNMEMVQHQALERALAQLSGLSLEETKKAVRDKDYQYLQCKVEESLYRLSLS
jgi:hypothetical protein